MLLTTTVDWLRVAADGGVFKCNRPVCPRGCARRLWGHGWISRYVAAVRPPVRVQRFRCASCRAVVTPSLPGYWPRYQASADEIATVLAARLRSRRWPMPGARQRAGHWLRRLVAFAAFEAPGEDPLAVLERFHGAGVHFLV